MQNTGRKLREINNFSLYRCILCDLEFFESDEDMISYYDDIYLEGRYFTDILNWAQKKFFEEKITYKRLLEIGIGNGVFLNKAKEKGYEVYGIDLVQENIKFAKEKFGLENIFCTSLNEFKKETNLKFDIIVFFDVLEHIKEPITFIQDIKELLKERGIIILSVPNRERFIDTLEKDFPPNHLTRWNRTSLKFLLENEGFETQVEVKKLGLDDIKNFFRKNIRLKLATKILKDSIKTGDNEKLKKAIYLSKIKDSLLTFLSIIFIPFLIFPLPGDKIYCKCKKK